ncbi:MAG: UTP--glucose-1-phosphate uridylyltransferase, partial [Leptospira sp.]|nr:UTP--glucose-1-phosphate uridylyltransferase [Leptospira sp.]
TGILDSLLDYGYEYAFISNGDNLGATVEPFILEYLMAENLEFAMEMTPKTLADIKGGAIYRKTRNGKFLGLELLETAQVPVEHEHEFSGMGKFRTFSTNNLWISLKALKRRMQKSSLQLALIVNPKIIDGQEVLQLETAMGSAIGSFERTKGIIIPRDRFALVKKCEDYLIRRSDAYVLNADFSLTMTPARKKAGLDEVLVSLDDQFYKKLKGFENLLKQYPSLEFTKSLRVEGEIEFDMRVKITGDVSFKNETGKKQTISSLRRSEFKDEEVNF